MAVLSVKQDWPGWPAILAALLVGLGAGLFQGFFVTFFRVPSFVVTLAGLLGFQGLLLYVLGDTGTINLTDSQILDLANTFYSDYVGWIIAIVLLVPYVLLTLNGYRRRLAAGLDTGPPILLALRMAVVIAGVIVAVLIFNADRGVPLAVLIFIGIVILVDFVLRHTAFGRHVYAVGGNAEAARRAGISLSRIRLIVFASCSTLAAAGGVLLAVAPVRGEPGLRRERPPPQRHRRRRHRRRQPLRGPRHGVGGAARRAGHRLDLERDGPEGARLGREVHGHRRGAAAGGDGGRDRPPGPPVGRPGLTARA